MLIHSEYQMSLHFFLFMQETYRVYQMERESLTVDISVINSDVFKHLKPLINKVTSFSLVKIKNQLTKGLLLEKEGTLYDKKCTCFVKNVWRLPCKHQLVECINNSGSITLDIVHPRWRITRPSQNTKTKGTGNVKYKTDLYQTEF